MFEGVKNRNGTNKYGNRGSGDKNSENQTHFGHWGH